MATTSTPEDMEGNPEDRDFRCLMDLAQGFMGSQVLFAACDLGVFEALSAGPLDTASVAQVLGLSPHGTQLLLDACAGLGLLRVEGTGAYTLTPPSRDLLLTQGTRSQRSMLLYLGATAYVCWGHLGRAVREGRSQYPQADAVATEEPFAAIYRSEPERLLFMAALQDTWRVCGVRVLKAFDLSPFRVICDVGGGSGALAMACARLYPTSSVCVFDTPEVVAAAQTHFRPLGEAMPVQFYAGDFFRSRLPGAELYILARVLHDWTDNTCLQLLGRLQEAGRPGAAILVVEALLSADGRGPLRTLLLSLNMLVQTAGRERTEAQYHDLCSRAGFPHFRCRHTGGAYDVMLAWAGMPWNPEPGAQGCAPQAGE